MKYLIVSTYLALNLITTHLLAEEQSSPLSSPHVVKEVVSPIDLNTADVKDLLHRVKGIGPKRAQAIIKYRDVHHGFHRLEELGLVPGIGPAFVNKHLKALQTAFVIAKKLN